MHAILSRKLKIILSGYMVGGPLGGLVWHHLQYLLGLHQLGHQVLFVEDSNDYPSCYQPLTHTFTSDPTYGLNFLKTVLTSYNLQNNWAYYHQPTHIWHGFSGKKLRKFINEADIFINLSGINPLREAFQHIPVRVLLDTDPAFTQIRHLTEPTAQEMARRHNAFFSFGENFGHQDCQIPNDGFAWKPTRQPVVLAAWPCTTGNASGPWTTVMQWDSYKTRTYNGQIFGMKSASFDAYLSLPQQTTDILELALGNPTAPRDKLATAGWHLADPLIVSASSNSYKRYIQQSKGEWSVAKQGYVASYSGWFSERSANYLASGRPVVVQDTGFSRFLPTGRGLFSFTNPAEALAAIAQVNQNYAGNCHAARALAQEYFNSEKVLTDLLNNFR